MLTIRIQVIRSAPEIWLFPGNDGFLWTISIPGLELGLWGDDPYIFCTSSRVLLRTLLRVLRAKGATEWGPILEAPKFERLFVPASPSAVVEALHRDLGNPIVLR